MSLIFALVLILGGSSTQETPQNCEDTKSILDKLAQNTEPDDLIIVVAHLGNDERKQGLNYPRLHNVKTYLTDFYGIKRKPKTIILTEGERVRGYGSVVFYVKGKLAGAVKIRPNADLIAVDCAREPPAKPCPPDERNFYPCLDRYRKSRR